MSKESEAKLFLAVMRTREDASGAVDAGSDNTLLYTVTKLMICHLIDDFEAAAENYRVRGGVFWEREIEPGSYKRHPEETWPSSWDDHLAMAIYGYFFDKQVAISILHFAERNDWCWNGNYLGRIPLFVGVVKYCAGVRLSLLTQVVIALVYFANLFEARESTGGKILLWLASLTFSDTSYPLINGFIAIWRLRMDRLYHAGPKEMLGIYHGEDDPLSLYAPGAW